MIDCSAYRCFTTLGGLSHSSSGYVYSPLQRGPLDAGMLAPSVKHKNLQVHAAHITSSFSFHSTLYIALRSIDRIARSADFLSLPPPLYVHDHIELTLDRATSMCWNAGLWRRQDRSAWAISA